MGLTGIDELVFDFFDFFEYIKVWWLFTIKIFVFFEYIKVWWLFPIKFFDFFEYMQVWWLFPIKMFFFWVYAGLVNFKSSNLHILKKIKHFDREKSRNLHILKKIKNFRLYVGLTGIDELVFDFFDFFWVYTGLVTFHYHFFWFFWVYEGFMHFCHQKVDLFWVYAGLSICRFEYMPSKSCVFSFSCRFWRGTSHKTCRGYAILKWTKLKLKTGIRFWFSYYFILLKN